MEFSEEKVLGTPIGGVSDVDGDGDGFRTGPSGEDNIPVAATAVVETAKETLASGFEGLVNKTSKQNPKDPIAHVKRITEEAQATAKKYSEKFGDLKKEENAEKALRSVFPSVEKVKVYPKGEPRPIDYARVITLLQRAEQDPKTARTVQNITTEGTLMGKVGNYDGAATLGIYDIVEMISNPREASLIKVDFDFNPERVQYRKEGEIGKAATGLEGLLLDPMVRRGYTNDELGFITGAYVAEHEFNHAEHYVQALDADGYDFDDKTQKGAIKNLFLLRKRNLELSDKSNVDKAIIDGLQNLTLEEYESSLIRKMNQAKFMFATLTEQQAIDLIGKENFDKYGQLRVPDEVFMQMLIAGEVEDIFGSQLDKTKPWPDNNFLKAMQEDTTSKFYDSIPQDKLRLLMQQDARGRRPNMQRTSFYATESWYEYVAERRVADKFKLVTNAHDAKPAWSLMSAFLDAKAEQPNRVEVGKSIPPVFVNGERRFHMCTGIVSSPSNDDIRKLSQSYVEKLKKYENSPLGKFIKKVNDNEGEKFLGEFMLRSIAKRVKKRVRKAKRSILGKTDLDPNASVYDFYYLRSNSVRIKSESPYTNSALRERIKNRIMAGSEGGRPGQWSARKAQLLAVRYRAAGGGYKKGKKPTKAQRSLRKWTREKWRTSDGKPALRDGKMRRYLPDKVWGKLTPAQMAATNRKKIAGDKRGQQFVPNTSVARKKGKAYRSRTR